MVSNEGTHMLINETLAPTHTHTPCDSLTGLAPPPCAHYLWCSPLTTLCAAHSTASPHSLMNNKTGWSMLLTHWSDAAPTISQNNLISYLLYTYQWPVLPQLKHLSDYDGPLLLLPPIYFALLDMSFIYYYICLLVGSTNIFSPSMFLPSILSTASLAAW